MHQPVWTTQDELLFVRDLYSRRKIVELRRYVRVAHERRWWGEGMQVEAGVVILAARDLLTELETLLRA